MPFHTCLHYTVRRFEGAGVGNGHLVRSELKASFVFLLLPSSALPPAEKGEFTYS